MKVVKKQYFKTNLYNGYFVETFSNYKNIEFWIGRKGYGLKSFLIGMDKKQFVDNFDSIYEFIDQNKIEWMYEFKQQIDEWEGCE